jgi:4-amino-4-deoxy-L-arabinose transferase-like glycosyltransferase
MKNISGRNQVMIIILAFVISRCIAFFSGVQLNIRALYLYWQFLDLDTLKNHLLSGVWYDHAQPPLFNLFLGFILKTGGNYYFLLFCLVLKLVSLCNGLLLFKITRKLCNANYIPLITALIYLMSPATLVIESELFYTSFVSLLLLLSVLFLIRLTESEKWWNSFGVILSICMLCLTRSIYHIAWLFLIFVLLIFYFRKKIVLKPLILASLMGLLLVGSWYVKNKMLFNKLAVSTWVGMNLARNVFHDNEIKDSARIEAYEPFSKISVYRKFLDPQYELKYKGLNDPVLIQEMKNDSFINETQVSYIPVSDLYEKASIHYIQKNPVAYLKNVIESSILFFSPATIYSLALENASKLKYYDLIYSFNLTIFANNKQERRVLLILSSIPKMIIYLFVFFIFFQLCIKSRSITSWNLFIVITIVFVFLVSSLFEHYENMRFRYEVEPLFLILAAQLSNKLYYRFQIRNSVTSE